MIDKLRRRMIGVSAASLLAVFVIIFIILYTVSIRQLNDNMDMLADRISMGDGFFKPFDKDNPRPPDMERFPDFFTDETPFSTRFFVLWYDNEGVLVRENTESVSAVSKQEAMEYAAVVMTEGRERGWYEGYRYKLMTTDRGRTVIFVDGSMNRATASNMLLNAGLVLAGSMLIILLVIILLSKRAVRPIARSYEKQQQFITDADQSMIMQ